LFYAQHNYPGVRFLTGGDWDYSFSALHSSSYMSMNPLMAWFTGNIGYHHVHHLNAKIPFYRLPEAMAALPELQTPVTLTLSPRTTLACLRLHLWDEANEALVPFPRRRRESAAHDANEPSPPNETGPLKACYLNTFDSTKATTAPRSMERGTEMASVMTITELTE
jgi:fatty acid desaturase